MFDVFGSTFCETLKHCDSTATALHKPVFLILAYTVKDSMFLSGQGGEGITTVLPQTEGWL